MLARCHLWPTGDGGGAGGGAVGVGRGGRLRAVAGHREGGGGQAAGGQAQVAGVGVGRGAALVTLRGQLHGTYTGRIRRGRLLYKTCYDLGCPAILLKIFHYLGHIVAIFY
jgi:hypothetical protein